MRISNINNRYYIPYFERKLTPKEKVDYRQNAITPALNYLGTEEVAMIIHGTAYPEDKTDIGVGSPYGKVAAQLIPFEILHGFNSNQLGPVGELSSVREISPYKSSVGAKNYLFIDMHELATEKYANILDESTINKVFNHTRNNDKNYTYSDFPEAYANYEYLIGIAYKNYKKQLNEYHYIKDKNLINLKNEFDEFMRKNKDIWEYGLFDILANIYGNEDYSKWNEADKNLINGLRNENPDSIERYKKIMQRSKNDLDVYCFGQFILNKQIKENTAFRKNNNFKYISDMLVGFSPADEWANQELFLNGYRMGCPYGGENGGMQRWNVPVLDPKKLFNYDGSLAEGGMYLKEKLEDALTDFENVRIDHALGLVDPYIYEKYGTRKGNISNMPDIDPDGNYKKILDRIILPTLKAHNLDKNSPVWENLVTETPTFNRIYYDEHQLPGITQLEYNKAQDFPNSENWALIGSHDSDPANIMIKKDWIKKNNAWEPRYLAGVLNANHNSEEYCKKIAQNDSERVKAKFAELFMMCKKIQISFADFFGIEKTYNQGGNDTNPDNWKLRLNNNDEDEYYRNLSSKSPTALNMAEILKLAVIGKRDMDSVTHKSSKYSDDEIKNIIKNLERYENILKE